MPLARCGCSILNDGGTEAAAPRSPPSRHPEVSCGPNCPLRFVLDTRPPRRSQPTAAHPLRRLPSGGKEGGWIVGEDDPPGGALNTFLFCRAARSGVMLCSLFLLVCLFIYLFWGFFRFVSALTPPSCGALRGDKRLPHTAAPGPLPSAATTASRRRPLFVFGVSRIIKR